MSEITVKITGTRPYMQHNGRLANPIDPWTQRLKKLTGKKSKTDEDLIEIMRTESRAGLYETEDGMVGIPVVNLWATFYEGAKGFKRGPVFKRAVRPLADAEVVPIYIDGEQVSADDFLMNPDNIDYRSVVIQRRRVMRSRPILRDWSGAVTFEIDPNLADLRDVRTWMERAGNEVGLGEMRPTMGTFAVEVEG